MSTQRATNHDVVRIGEGQVAPCRIGPPSHAMPPRVLRAVLGTALAAALFASALALADAGRQPIGSFSSMPVGTDFGADWQVVTLPSVDPTLFRIERDGDRKVLRAQAQATAASLLRTVDWDVATSPTLHWRWRVDHVVDGGDMTRKATDDFAARLYVMFDFPPERMTLVERTKLKVARWLYGDTVPSAALCYVWANDETFGARAWSPYSDRVRIIVLRNRRDAVGQWVAESRNVADDFREAFGEKLVPPVGVAVAADTDQTGESVTAWFGDIYADGPAAPVMR